MSTAGSRLWSPARARAGDHTTTAHSSTTPRITAQPALRIGGLLLGVFALAASGCMSTRLDRDAARVRVIPAGAAPAGCTAVGDIEVTVDTGLGPLQRDALAVQDQLETLARNQAPGLGATDLQALSAPRDGNQRFRAWRCDRP